MANYRKKISLRDHLPVVVKMVIHQNYQPALVAVKYLAALGECYALKAPSGQVYVSRDHNVYKDSCLHPIHSHNVDKS